MEVSRKEKKKGTNPYMCLNYDASPDIVYFMQLKPMKSWPGCRKQEFCLVPWCCVVFVVRSVWQAQPVQCLLQSLWGSEQIQLLLLMCCSTGAAAGCMELCSWDDKRLPIFLLCCKQTLVHNVPFSATASPGAGCSAELPSAWSILITEYILKLFKYPFRLFMSWSYTCLVLVRTLLCRKTRREFGIFFWCVLQINHDDGNEKTL